MPPILGALKRSSKTGSASGVGPRTGPGDPDQVRVADILIDYAKEHGSEVSSPTTLAASIEPLIAFFGGDTVATMTPERAKEYWIWRRMHSIRGLDRARTEVEVVERGVGDGTDRKPLRRFRGLPTEYRRYGQQFTECSANSRQPALVFSSVCG